MKKRFLPLAALMALLASCGSESSELAQPQPSQPTPAQAEQIPVVFGAYAQRGVTRSGTSGDLTTNVLKSTTHPGFGVFAYYTNNEDYASMTQPNFMYNQKVNWNGSAFDYTPLRYWPNEYGVNAASQDIDRVTFFAYAPYVACEFSTGWVVDPGNEDAAKYGITGFSRNTNTGDPFVKYVASFESGKQVDLCWGVYNQSDANDWMTFNSDAQVINGNGLPWMNVQRAKTVDQRLTFTFKHALAQLNMTVDANVDGSTENALGKHENGTVDGMTKIYVRSLKITGITDRAALNLNNVKANVPLWMNYQGNDWIESGKSVTVYDGLLNGSEGTAGAEDPYETVIGFNADVISNEGNSTEGVTNVTKDLFSGNSVLVIPTGEAVKITITYDVETAVDDLPEYLSDGKTHGTSIENCITKEITVPAGALKLEGGKKYTIGLHLGMNSVKFDATVDDDAWETEPVIGYGGQLG